MYQQYMYQIQASISNLTSDDLKELLNNEVKLEDRVTELLLNLENDKISILGQNRLIAEENLIKEPEIIELRRQVNEISEKGKNLCVSIQEKLSEYKLHPSNINQDTALALVQAAAAESEEESDKLVKQFLENEMILDIFLDQFVTLRRKMHLRKIAAEKMSEILRKANNLNSKAPQSGFFPDASMYNPTNVPYPTGPMSMPMPPKRHPF